MYNRPVIKRSMPVYHLTDTIFRIGAQLGITSQFNDPKGHMQCLIAALDGSDLQHIIQRVQETYPNLSNSDILQGLEVLDQQGFLDEACDFQDIPERFQANVEYFAAISGNTSLTAKEAHRKLEKAHVTLLGLGGGGSNIATLLAGTGLGNLTIVDYDKIEKSNLGRQFLYQAKDVGKLKVDIAEQSLQNMNPDLTTHTFNKKIGSAKDVYETIQDADIVLCAMDEPPFVAQRRINKAIVDLNKPCVFGATQLSHGRVFTIIPHKTGCFDCLHLHYSKQDTQFVSQFRGFHEANFKPPTIAYGPTIWQIALIMVDECVRLLTGYAEPRAISHQFEVDYLNYSSFAHPDWPRFEECPTCGSGSYDDWEIFQYYLADI